MVIVYSVPGLFFFQAEDGIRYGTVTGVQTCALPICPCFRRRRAEIRRRQWQAVLRDGPRHLEGQVGFGDMRRVLDRAAGEIGRASCRERVWRSVGAGWLE